MAAKPKVLCLGYDPVLNRTRRLILQRSFDVTLAKSLPEAVPLLWERRFDLVLLCHSLTDGDCRAVLALMDTLPHRPKVLALTSGRDRSSLAPPDEEFAPAGPAELLQKAAAMTGIALTLIGDGEPPPPQKSSLPTD